MSNYFFVQSSSRIKRDIKILFETSIYKTLDRVSQLPHFWLGVLHNPCWGSPRCPNPSGKLGDLLNGGYATHPFSLKSSEVRSRKMANFIYYIFCFFYFHIKHGKLYSYQHMGINLRKK
jgi:hypothetical protein